MGRAEANLVVVGPSVGLSAHLVVPSIL